MAVRGVVEFGALTRYCREMTGMALFIGIAGPWLLVAVLLQMAHRRAEDPEAGQWRSEPSRFFGGPEPRTEPEPTATVDRHAAG